MPDCVNAHRHASRKTSRSISNSIARLAMFAVAASAPLAVIGQPTGVQIPVLQDQPLPIVALPQLILSVSQSSYASVDPPQITLILAMPSTAQNTWVVQTMADTTIRLAKLTKDGIPVEPHDSGGVGYINGFESAQLAGLQGLAAGQQVLMTAVVYPDGESDAVLMLAHLSLQSSKPLAPPGQPVPPAKMMAPALAPPGQPAPPAKMVAPALKAGAKGAPRAMVELPELSPRTLATFYPLAHPGKYVLQLSYSYSGDDDGRTPIFRGPLLSNEVTFNLQ